MAAKKDFKSNPALQFITQPTQEREETKPGKQSERKSKRLNLLLKPSIMDSLTKIAYVNRTSVNALINDILTRYTADNSDLVQKYDSIFPDQNKNP